MDKINLKINRAKDHLQELQIRLREFINIQPYKISVKRNTERHPVYYISEAKDVPIEISLIAGEVIQNLRTALDHLAYKLFKINTPSGDDGKHIYFPISDSLDGYNYDKTRKTKGMSENAINLIDTIKPYKEGNKTLWQLHQLNNIDKHRLLFTVGSSFGSLNLGATMERFMKRAFPDQADSFPKLPPLFLKPADNMFPLRVGSELFVDAPDAEEVPNMQFRIDIVINEPGIIVGESVVNVLQSMIDEVEAVLVNFNPTLSVVGPDPSASDARSK